MAVKYVFVTGGVVSGLGKGITAASLGRLLKARGYTVTMQKFDPYINIDPGTMNPVQHGEVFVTDDGAETDLDLGHYERFIDESLTKNSNVTTGKIYWSVLQKERRGDFGGGTVQVIPHITNEIKSKFYRNPAAKGTEIAIIEVGGTVGDIESQPFLESIRQFQHEKGPENVILIHVTLIPYLKASQEMKTKPTQASVKELQGMGIQPDIIVCRSEYPLDTGMKDKISLFCNLPASHVLQNLDVEYLYEAPLAMEKEHLAQVVCECLHLDCPEPDLKDWIEMVENLRHPTQEVTVALVGKYIQLHDAYISVVEALKHGGIYSHTTVNIKWIDSETVTADNVDELFSDVSGILVPGGFGHRGIEGKITAKALPFVAIIPHRRKLFSGGFIVRRKLFSGGFIVLDLVTCYVDHKGVLGGHAGLFGYIEGKLGAGTIAPQAEGVRVGGSPVPEGLAPQSAFVADGGILRCLQGGDKAAIVGEAIGAVKGHIQQVFALIGGHDIVKIDGGGIVLPDHHLTVGKGVALAGIAVIRQGGLGDGQGQICRILS